MTKTTAKIAAFVLSALMTLGGVAGMNGIAASQYAAADNLARAAGGQTAVALQRVVIVGHRAKV